MKKYVSPQMLVIQAYEKDVLTESEQTKETYGVKELIIEDIW